MKKTIAFFIAVTVCAALTFICVNAVDEVSGKCGDDAYYVYNNETHVLTIKGEGAVNGSYWDDKMSKITKVTVGVGITSIGDNAFYCARNLENVTLPDGLVSIGDYAFSSCASLKKLILPDSVKYIGKQAFSSCASLEEFYIGKSVEHIGEEAFMGCQKLKKVFIPDTLKEIDRRTFEGFTEFDFSENNPYYRSLNGVVYSKDMTMLYTYPMSKTDEKFTLPSSVTSICDYAFEFNSYINEVILPDGLQTIGSYAFLNASNLKSITVPDSVTSVGYGAFLRCESLESAYIGSGLTEIPDAMFSRCINLKTVTVSDGLRSVGRSAFANAAVEEFTFPEGFESLGIGAFSYCNHLKTVTVNSDITIDRINVTNVVFGSGCTSLDTLTIGKNVTTVDSAFFTVPNLDHIVLDPDNDHLKYENGMLTTSDGAVLLRFTGLSDIDEFRIPDGVKKICKSALYNFGAKKIVVPSSVEEISEGAFVCRGDFEIYFECDKPTAGGYAIFLDLEPRSESKTTVSVYYSVYGREWLDGFTNGGNKKDPGVKLTGYMPENVTSGKCGKDAYWSYDKETKTLTISGSGKPDNHTADRYPWSVLKDEAEAIVIDGIERIPDSAFTAFTQLKTVTLGKVKQVEDAFKQCKIETVYFTGELEDWLNIYYNNVASSLGYHSANLYINGEPAENIVIPEGRREIKSAAFAGFANIKTVTIPESVTKIGDYAFYKCSSLECVTFEGFRTPSKIGTLVFDPDVTVRYPSSEPWDSEWRYTYKANVGGNWVSYAVETEQITERITGQAEVLTEPSETVQEETDAAAVKKENDNKSEPGGKTGLPAVIIAVSSVVILVSFSFIALTKKREVKKNEK